MPDPLEQLASKKKNKNKKENNNKKDTPKMDGVSKTLEQVIQEEFNTSAVEIPEFLNLSMIVKEKIKEAKQEYNSTDLTKDELNLEELKNDPDFEVIAQKYDLTDSEITQFLSNLEEEYIMNMMNEPDNQKKKDLNNKRKKVKALNKRKCKGEL